MMRRVWDFLEDWGPELCLLGLVVTLILQEVIR